MTPPVSSKALILPTITRYGSRATEFFRVIRDGLRALLARDQAIERWLRDEVAAAYDALKAAPSRAVSAAQVRARLAAVPKPATKKS